MPKFTLTQFFRHKFFIGKSYLALVMRTLFTFLGCLLIFSCTIKKTKQYQASGTILGTDTGSCRGYILKINGSDTAFRFYNFPQGSAVDSTHFPLAVKFNYLDTGRCGRNHIVAFQSVVPAN
jgi:hypothetical protein